MTNPLPVNYLLDEYKEMSDEDIAHLYADVVDRWTWDTGSEEDAKLMRKLGQEHGWRDSSRKIFKEPKTTDDLAEAFARDIANELDREILRTLINLDNDKEA